MTKVPTLFFAAGALFALAGMIWGIQMSATQDHSLSPAHGHLNLIGFVAMSVFGTFYALNAKAANSKLALLHFALTVAAVVIMVPGIVMALTEQGEALAKIGSVLAVLSMGIFAYNVIFNGVGQEDEYEQKVAAE